MTGALLQVRRGSGRGGRRRGREEAAPPAVRSGGDRGRGGGCWVVDFDVSESRTPPTLFPAEVELHGGVEDHADDEEAEGDGQLAADAQQAVKGEDEGVAHRPPRLVVGEGRLLPVPEHHRNHGCKEVVSWLVGYVYSCYNDDE